MGNYLVIGGSSGIGRAITTELSNAGHHVIATFFKNQPATEKAGVDLHFYDVLAEDPMGFIPDQLQGLVYCPGSINLRPFERIRPADFEKDFKLQVTGAIRCIQAALPNLKLSGNASILLFSTVAVQVGLQFHTQVAVSKGAIEGLTRSLAAEYAPRIRVNCIAPSLTETNLSASLLNTDQKKEANAQRHPMKKIGSPEDIAGMASFLLSDRAGWITGQVIHVDGGMSSLKT